MLPTLIKPQERIKLLVSECGHSPPSDQPLTHENDNLQKENKVTVKELSKLSGLDENTLLDRIAAILRDRNEDLMSIIDATKSAS